MKIIWNYNLNVMIFYNINRKNFLKNKMNLKNYSYFEKLNNKYFDFKLILLEKLNDNFSINKR